MEAFEWLVPFFLHVGYLETAVLRAKHGAITGSRRR